MPQFRQLEYDREAAVAYAHRWAYGRNPAYYDFEKIGGDCTNYASQCVFAGAGVMNYTPVYGWYYISTNNRAPSWSSVQYFYDFMVSNQGAGPYGAETGIGSMEIGDVVQLATQHPYYHHTPVIVRIDGFPTLGNIYVAAHSFNADMRPLASYDIRRIRFLHIEGVRAPIR
ncbi:MAG: amidase [Clostridium sp. SCN 57-10]|nr:MAG: amidase [Clostridium sp. SCN 57-10]